MSLLTSTEKLWFPSFILFLQVVMLILFGVLVEYDDFGKPLGANASSPARTSDGETPDDVITTYYPRALATTRIYKYDNFVWAEVKFVL